MVSTEHSKLFIITLCDLIQCYFHNFKVPGCVLEVIGSASPKLSQLGRQLTNRKRGYKLNSSFRFTNVHHVKSNLGQLRDYYNVMRVLIG